MPFAIAMLRFLKHRGVLAVAGAMLGIWFTTLAIRGAQWHEIKAALAEVSALAVVSSLAIVLLSAFIRAVRWRLTWTGEPVSVGRLFAVENASLGLNNVAPVRLLDEPAIFAMLTLRDGHRGPMVIASVIMTRIQDTAFTLSFVLASVLLVPELKQHAAAVIGMSVFLSTVLLALLNLGWLVEKLPFLGRIPGIEPFGGAVRDLWGRRRRLAVTFALTAIYWLTLGPAALILATSVGIDISLFQATVVVLGATFFATATPGLPGAVGTFELATVEILGLWGVGHAPALLFGILVHLVLFFPSVAIAAMVLPREGLGMALIPRKKRALEPASSRD